MALARSVVYFHQKDSVPEFDPNVRVDRYESLVFIMDKFVPSLAAEDFSFGPGIS